jgi:hypothetical protein
MGTDPGFLAAWKPYCGAEYHTCWSGEAPLVCGRNPHGPDTRHRDSETGFEWW